MRIVADPAPSKSECSVTQNQGVDAGHAQVNRFSLDVKAILRDAGGVSAESCVGGRSAVATDDVDFAAGMADGSREVGENVVETRVEVADVVGDVVAEKVVEPGQGRGNVLRAAAVDDVESLAGVRVVQKQRMVPTGIGVFAGR